MTTKEKSKELIDKFLSREMALKCVDEIINELNETLETSKNLHFHVKGLLSGSLMFWGDLNS